MATSGKLCPREIGRAISDMGRLLKPWAVSPATPEVSRLQKCHHHCLPTHHEMLKGFGARVAIDYRSPNVVEEVQEVANGKTKYMVDCIVSLESSLRPIAQITESGSTITVALPVILRDATETTVPEYSMEPENDAEWKDGVEVLGTRTHFYLDLSRLNNQITYPLIDLQNKFFAEHLQADIMPSLLISGGLKPNRRRIVESATLLERAENALDLLWWKAPSGERLVWRVAE